jgi:drug/metabolite transporter (DMT)-like permease
MLSRIKTRLGESRADVAMSLIVIVWGVHYIVVKDALSHFAPLTFNAIRFSLGLSILLIAALRNGSAMRIRREDMGKLLVLGLIGPFGYQVLFIQAMGRTTSTNVALLVATMPTWTALLTISMGIVMIRRQMIVGIVMSLIGVAFVVLGRAGASFSLSSDDLLGSGLILVAAMLSAIYNIHVKSLIDRYGGSVIAVWTYILTTVGLIIVASPQLIRLTAHDLPLRVWPNLLYSGLLSSAMGFLVEYYAIRRIGPPRTAAYYNFIPLVAAAAGVIIIGEPLSIGLIIGGSLVLSGVVIVRRNTYLRFPPPKPLPEPRDTAVRVSPAVKS